MPFRTVCTSTTCTRRFCTCWGSTTWGWSTATRGGRSGRRSMRGRRIRGLRGKTVPSLGLVSEEAGVMLATVQELTGLIPPPTSPVDARGDWNSVESALGLKLPTDYKQIIEAYGTGRFFGWLW